MAMPGIKNKCRPKCIPVISVEKIIETVCEYYVLDAAGLKGKCRVQVNVHARYVIFYFLRKHTKLTFKAIGKMFNRDHTTVIHGLETLDDIMETEPNVMNEIEDLQTKINGIGKS